MSQLRGPQLCLVTDPAVPDLLERVELALEAGITMVQLRGHHLTAARLYQLACQLQVSCLRYGVPLIVNDRLDVGLALHVNGFQVGVNSLPLAAVRQLVGEAYLLGVSIHTLSEAESAIDVGADFMLAGTILPSPSHPQGETTGFGLLRQIKQRAPSCPVLAIGGMTARTAGVAMEAGADGVAVISAILEAVDVRNAVRELRSAINLY